MAKNYKKYASGGRFNASNISRAGIQQMQNQSQIVTNALQRQANQQLMNQGLQLMEQSQPYTLGNNNSNGKVFGSAFYKRSYVSGMNRICVYDNMGSDYTTCLLYTSDAADE